MQYTYHVVDVFTAHAMEGNALAVFVDARGLGSETMLKIARELNLSETTFVLPPADPGHAAKVRIFTPFREMIFAGHPTVGTASVLLRSGVVPAETTQFVLEENIGPVRVRVDGTNAPIIWLETPPISRGTSFDRIACARALGLTEDDLLPGVPAQIVTAGNPNVYVALRSPQIVDRIEVDTAAIRALFAHERDATCMFAFAPTPDGAYSRMFAPELGIIEDPATGSATGPLASFMMEHSLAPSSDGTRLISEQGTKMGRRSILHVLVHGERGREGIEVGGQVVPFAVAAMTLDASDDAR